MTEQKLLEVAEVAKRLDFTPMYVRQLMRRGKLKTVRVPLSETSMVWKYMIEESSVRDLENARAKPRPRAAADGRRAYKIRLNAQELAAITAFLTEKGFAEVLAAIDTPNKENAYKRRKVKMIHKLKEVMR